MTGTFGKKSTPVPGGPITHSAEPIAPLSLRPGTATGQTDADRPPLITELRPKFAAAVGTRRIPLVTTIRTDEARRLTLEVQRGHLPVALGTADGHPQVAGPPRRPQGEDGRRVVVGVGDGLELAGGDADGLARPEIQGAVQRLEGHRAVEDDEDLLLVLVGVEAADPAVGRDDVVVDRDVVGAEDLAEAAALDAPEAMRVDGFEFGPAHTRGTARGELTVSRPLVMFAVTSVQWAFATRPATEGR